MCRQAFWEGKLLERMVPDIQKSLGLRAEKVQAQMRSGPDDGNDEVGDLWDPDLGSVGGGQNWGDRLPARQAGPKPGDPMPLEEERDDDEDPEAGSGSSGGLPF
jgi:hypothetical protein